MTVNKTVRAVVTDVPFGDFSIQGLMLPDGSFAVGVSQVAELFQFDKNQAPREVKSLLGKGFQFDKVKSELHPKEVNIISLEQFQKVAHKLAIKGNQLAQDFCEVMFDLAIHQLFCDAFGVKFETAERQELLKERLTHKKQFHPLLTRWLQADGCQAGKDYGIAVNKFKANASLPLKSVNEYDSDELHRLNNAEVRYDILRVTGMSHEEAMKFLR